MNQILPKPLEKNPNYGLFRGYQKDFYIEETKDVLEGILIELKALESEGFYPHHIRLEENNVLADTYRIEIIVVNKDLYIV